MNPNTADGLDGRGRNPNSLANLRPAWDHTTAPMVARARGAVAVAKIVHIRRLCRDASPAAVKRLVELMGDDNGRVAVAACTAILDRAGVTPADNMRTASGDAAGSLIEMLREIAAARLAMQATPPIVDAVAVDMTAVVADEPLDVVAPAAAAAVSDTSGAK